MRTIGVVATMILALLSSPRWPSLADAQQSTQDAPAAQFDLLIGKWTGTHVRVGSGGLLTKEMVIENVAPDGKVSGYFAENRRKWKGREFKAEKKGNAIHLFYKSSSAEEFAGQLMGQDQISGTFSVRNEQGLSKGTIKLTFTREK